MLFLYLLTGMASCFFESDTSNGGPTPSVTPVDQHWSFATTPVWADEFNYIGSPAGNLWGYDIGGSGWGNNELQYYTSDVTNAEVRDGRLFIRALKEEREGMLYTSARLVTRSKGDFRYGRFEISAKLPSGRGTWPAIWMLPTDGAYGGWPHSGEIDIMEHVGYDPNRVHITVHTGAFNHVKGTQVGRSKIVPNATRDFHRYRVDWTPYAVRGYIDDVQLFEFVNNGKGPASWPFDKRFHLLLNIAIGGNWGGTQGIDDSIFPATMEVDYVRVYKMIEK